jgi:hypothetical protein
MSLCFHDHTSFGANRPFPADHWGAPHPLQDHELQVG